MQNNDGRPEKGGRWSHQTGDRYIQCLLQVNYVGTVLEWSLRTSGRSVRVVTNTGLTVLEFTQIMDSELSFLIGKTMTSFFFVP
jgi:hypothetical protein